MSTEVRYEEMFGSEKNIGKKYIEKHMRHFCEVYMKERG